MYGDVVPDKNFYSVLGFIETEDDNTAEAFEHVDKLDTRNKRLLLRQLARELGMKVSDGSEDDTNDDEEEKMISFVLMLMYRKHSRYQKSAI